MSVHRCRLSRAVVRAAGVVALVAACANPAADNAIHAQSALVGMPKQTLLSCAGVPERQAAVDNLEFYSYRNARIISYPGSVGAFGSYWGPGWGYGGGWPVYAPEVRSTGCEATFTLRNGAVERLLYGGGSSLQQCYQLVHNCLALIPQQIPPRPATPVR